MDTSSTLRSPNSSSPNSSSSQASPAAFTQPSSTGSSTQPASYSPLRPIRRWLDEFNVRNPKTARWIAKLIPAHCPFERDVKLLGRTLAHIPPLCKLNPFYDQLVMLRFRALCYLVDECGEDIGSYC
ncbi:MAG: Mo-dependent nitrogenase C-terminal domain-containing protein [Pegethrix bostrychoides GSE-TBD4-15B]|jgi:hypothetical protein|uniref:Mo-dependent nitrogenase C-terminal domain-containing protein n=1 Tax=Pegethrix bostrychoides GSE-TBD4-15B TaxID=2839662 RepID=A0A951PAJ4_9CYAN|nr:Mo-dependent nitrogenase C-terminal domain-containing protein [Pegethrix bostrychoides GSE-TBD4-15B]